MNHFLHVFGNRTAKPDRCAAISYHHPFGVGNVHSTFPTPNKKTCERSERENNLKSPKKTEIWHLPVESIQGPDLFVDDGVAIELRIFSPVREEHAMQLSARNQLRGKVQSVKLGSIMAEVVLVLPDGQEIVSAITRSSAESLGLTENDEVLAIIKSTEVMIAKA